MYPNHILTNRSEREVLLSMGFGYPFSLEQKGTVKYVIKFRLTQVLVRHCTMNINQNVVSWIRIAN